MSGIKVGDTVEMIAEDHFYFSKGDRFIVKDIDKQGDLWAQEGGEGICVNPKRVRKVEEPLQPEKKGTSMKFKSWVFKHSPAKKCLTLADVPAVDKEGKENWYVCMNTKYTTPTYELMLVKDAPTIVHTPEIAVASGLPLDSYQVSGVVNRPGQRNVLPDVGSSVLSLDEAEAFRCILYPLGSSEYLTYFVMWKDNCGRAFSMDVNGHISPTSDRHHKGRVLDLVAESVEAEFNHA